MTYFFFFFIPIIALPILAFCIPSASKIDPLYLYSFIGLMLIFIGVMIVKHAG